jgi:hypothetical protein
MGLNPCETGAFALIDKPVSLRRQRMIDDMTARRVKEKVQQDFGGLGQRSRRRSLSRPCPWLQPRIYRKTSWGIFGLRMAAGRKRRSRTHGTEAVVCVKAKDMKEAIGWAC